MIDAKAAQESAIARLQEACPMCGRRPNARLRKWRTDAWERALADPAFVAALREGIADVEAGRVRPWSEVKARLEQEP